MADDVTQVYTIDGSDAIAALAALSSGFDKMSASLEKSGGAFTAFNSSGQATVSTLNSIATNANAAADAMNKLASVKASGGVSAQQLTAGANAAQQLNAAITQTSQSSAQAAQAVNNLGNSAQNSLNKATRSGNNYAISLATLSRVVGTQLIVRGLNGIRDATEESFDNFIQFNKAAAEVQTLSESKSLPQIRDQLVGVSNAFNVPLLEAAHAQYETLSNGFTKAGDDSKVMTAAFKLSKVGISTTAQSVDLVSTALNAYGKSADEAENVSGKLFKVIDLGRVTASDLSGAFGRVAPLAHQVGLSEDEIGAAFSSITVGGVKSSEAATQISAALNSFIKPSKTAAAAIHELGFASGEDILQTLGFQGAMQALIGTTDKSADSVAKLFPNIRALKGVFTETGTAVQTYQDHLEQIRAASSAILNEKYDIRIESNGEQVANDLNKLKNFFTAELGQALVGFVHDTTSAVGGIDTIISAMKAFGPVVAVGALALTGFAVAAGIAKIAAFQFGGTATTAAAGTTALGASAATATAQVTTLSTAMNALKGLALGVTLGLAARAAGQFVGDLLPNQGDSTKKRFEDRQGSNNLEKSKTDAALNLQQLANNEEFRVANERVAGVRKSFNEEIEATRDKVQAQVSIEKEAIAAVVAAQQEKVSKLKSASDQAASQSQNAAKKSSDLQGQLEDTHFNFAIRNNSEAVKSFRERQRAEELASGAAAKLPKAKTGNEIEAADKAFTRAEAFARQAVSSAQAAKNVGAEVKAQQTLESILSSRAGAEKKLSTIRDADSKKLDKAHIEEEARLKTIKEAGEAFLENSSPLNKEGKDAFNPKQQADRLEKSTKAFNTIKSELLKSGNLDAGKILDLANLKQVKDGIPQIEIKKIEVAEGALDDLRKKIEGVVGTIDAQLAKTAPNVKALEGKTVLEQATETTEQLKQQEKHQNDIDAAAASRKNNQIELNGLAEDATASFKEDASLHAKALANVQKFGSKSTLADQQTVQLGKLREGFAEIAQNPGLEGAKDKFAALNDQAVKLSENIVNSKANGLAFGSAKQNAGRDALLNGPLGRASVERFQAQRALELQNSNSAIGKNFTSDELGASDVKRQSLAKSAQAQLEDAKNKLNDNLSGASAGTAGIGTAAQGSVEGINALSAALDPVREKAEASAAAINSIKPSTGGGEGGSESHALGGKVGRFAGGGQYTDTINAQLSKGEYVVNADSTRKWYSQLQSINAGKSPSGSSVNNSVNVGDITVNESKNGESTAREVLNLIRREQRRGTGNSIR